MSDKFLENVANLLEKVAEYLDQEEAETLNKQRQVTKTLSEKIASATGEEFTPELLEKLASTDQTIIETLVKLAERSTQTQPLDDIGEPSNIGDTNDVVHSKNAHIKEANSQANDQFLNWIMS
jgi:predicted house-cleaning noncanonical NTP pyrophosphatase (MazG superfamily)